ncbi:sigma-70 family RNA polymerase sigma factor [Clostridium sp. AWRP]|uniref:sigma-70 family RNA polymerase sigma factor n=1 Tax=Clostridium sp. AWRP TaxID=2212991 RepID=UPI000FDBBC11|nr:sigma-70 family RNA polymerase sigma factor [Clostridium sp. AWRP]AZV56047.1 sigma-70 family RNA polymerase sigma factor [Clostridium sp. AWRP]
MVFENLLVLLIAAKEKCPQEVAFKYLDRYLEHGTNFKRPPVFSWTPEDIQDVMKFKQEGISNEEIGSYYGVKANTIKSLFYKKTTQSPVDEPRRRGTKLEVQEMLKLNKQGWKPRELAEKFDIKIHTVYSRIKKAKQKAEV